ncbi:MAG: hypothetical protein HOW73_26800 [Polyangiaceae bacterium]|nr:hypothetical protein [Polyangiaceae bacterium]
MPTRAYDYGHFTFFLVGCTAIGGADEFQDQTDDDECSSQRCDDGLCPKNACSTDDPPGSTGSSGPGGQGPIETPADLPPGWIGPVMHNTSPEVSECAEPYSDLVAVGYTSVSAPPASCSACSCESSGCSATLSFWQGEDDCEEGCAASRALPQDDCVDLRHVASCSDNGAKYSATGATVTTPTCAASNQQPTTVDVTWATVSTLCLAADAGASTGSCIARAGDVDCPAPFLARAVVYTNIVDTRGCTECSCAPGSCGGIIDLYEGNGCGDGHKKGSVAAPFADGCESFGDKPRARYTPDPGAGCTATPSSPTGEVTLSDPYTVCCG